MGGMILGLGAVGAASGIAGGMAQEEAYEAEAKMAEMEAEAEEVRRKRELNEALAMQAVMFATQGRAPGEGSAQIVSQTDIGEAEADIRLVKQAGKARATGLRVAGRRAKMRGFTQGLTTMGRAGIEYSQVK